MKRFVLSILSHSSLLTFELSSFCYWRLFQLFNFCFESLDLDVTLRSQFIFTFMFDVLSSTFNQSSISFRSFRSCNTIFSFFFSLSLFKLFFVGNNTYFATRLTSSSFEEFFSWSKFSTLILPLISLTSENVILTYRESLPRSKSIRSLLFFCIIFLFSEYHRFDVTH